MTAPLRLATFAVPLSGNKGSASMLLGLRDAFLQADIPVHLDVFSYYPVQDRKLAEGFENISVHPGHPKDIAFSLLPLLPVRGVFCRNRSPKSAGQWARAMAALENCDAVLLVGGTTFADSMLHKVPWNVLAALPGYYLRKPTLFLSQTIGPFERWPNRLAAKWTLRRATCVHGRGRSSRDWGQRLGIGACTYRPDLSFPMTVPDFAEIAGKIPAVQGFADALRNTAKPTVGVAPNSIVYQKSKNIGKPYIPFLVEVVNHIQKQGYTPVLIPHSYRSTGKGIHNNDRSLCQQVLGSLPPDTTCCYIDADLSSGQLRSLIGELHLLVASRFHSMVSALSTGVPPLTFGWGHHKYLEVLQEFDARDLYTPFQEMSVNVFKRAFARVLAEREPIAEKIRTRLETVRAEADALPGEILQLLSRNPEVAGKAPSQTS